MKCWFIISNPICLCSGSSLRLSVLSYSNTSGLTLPGPTPDRHRADPCRPPHLEMPASWRSACRQWEEGKWRLGERNSSPGSHYRSAVSLSALGSAALWTVRCAAPLTFFQWKRLSLHLAVGVCALQEGNRRQTGVRSMTWDLFIVKYCTVNILWSISTLRSLFWGWSFGYSKHAGAWLESLVCFLVVRSWPQPGSWHGSLRLLYPHRNPGTTLYFSGE